MRGIVFVRVFPQENLEIWSALEAILGLFYAYLELVVK